MFINSFISCCLILGGFIAAHAELSDSEWQKMKESAVNRPRRSIVNNDGCDAISWPRTCR